MAIELSGNVSTENELVLTGNVSTENNINLVGDITGNIVLGWVKWGNIKGTLSDQTDLQTVLNTKVDKVEGKGLSTNDYTTPEKTKLAGIETGAEVNDITDVQVDNVSVVQNKIAKISSNNFGKVDDVKVNGTTVVTNKVANVNVNFATLTGAPDDNLSLRAVLGQKLNANNPIPPSTKCKITYDSNGLVTGGSNLQASDIPNLTLSKITDVTATASELNVLDGITATTTELNYVDGVTSAIQTQLNDKENISNKVTSIGSSSSDTEYPTAKAVYTLSETKQSIIDSTHKLSSDLVDDTNHANRFVTAEEKVAIAGISEKEWAGNKTSTINSESTTTEYTSAYGVYHYHDATKQNIIDSSNKLSADYISDGVINKVVTQTEKTTWSSKQNAINQFNKLSSDLVDDNGNTNRFVTASEKITWNNKQNAINQFNKISADYINNGDTNKVVTQTEKDTWDAKSVVSVASTGTSTDMVGYITINGTEKKLAGGSQVIWRTY